MSPDFGFVRSLRVLRPTRCLPGSSTIPLQWHDRRRQACSPACPDRELSVAGFVHPHVMGVA